MNFTRSGDTFDECEKSTRTKVASAITIERINMLSSALRGLTLRSLSEWPWASPTGWDGDAPVRRA